MSGSAEIARRTRVPAAVLVVLAGIAGLVLAPPAAASDTRSERERVRRERAAVAADLDVLRADDAKIEQAIDALDAQLAAEERALDDAQRALDAATAEAEAAAARAAETSAEIDRIEGEVRSAAISEFILGGADDGVSLAPTGLDLREVASARALRDTVQRSAVDIVDELGAAREDDQVAQAEAEAAAAAAEGRRAAAAARLGDVQTARSQQVAFATELDQRIEARLAEAANLAAVDSQLSARLVQEQQALAARTAGVARGPATVVPRSGGNVPLATVRGITVHRDIADQLAALLNAADADGLSLGGSGYRDRAQQQRLREQNCPNPATSPASSCRPPTARPGQSMHEEGLAIDFTSGGRLITSRSNAAFRWMADNAGRFGFRNLPEEPWHWSTNGR